MFYVGQKVYRYKKTVRQQPLMPEEKWHPIEIGTVLTVRTVEVHQRRSGQIATGLRFQGITNRSFTYDNVVGLFELDYLADDFRPVVDRKTDISIFKAMLNPSDERVQA